jgi:hypothetical protein
MNKVTVATFASGVLAAAVIGLATPAWADNDGSVALPPGGPVVVKTQVGTRGGVNPTSRRV